MSINIEDLLTTARLTREGSSRFNLDYFQLVSHEDGAEPVNWEGHECGTSACAAGFAAERGVAGLSLHLEDEQYGGFREAGVQHAATGTHSFQALEKAYGIQRRTADFLFGTGVWPYQATPSAEMVAERIEAFCAAMQSGADEEAYVHAEVSAV